MTDFLNEHEANKLAEILYEILYKKLKIKSIIDIGLGSHTIKILEKGISVYILNFCKQKINIESQLIQRHDLSWILEKVDTSQLTSPDTYKKIIPDGYTALNMVGLPYSFPGLAYKIIENVNKSGIEIMAITPTNDKIEELLSGPGETYQLSNRTDTIMHIYY